MQGYAVKKKIDQSEDVRERLVACGIGLIQKHGFHATGIKDLVAAARIPKGSFYYYFSSKEEFASEVIASYIRPYVEKVEALALRRDKPALVLLREYFSEQITEFDNNPDAGGCLLGNLLGEIGDTSEGALESLCKAVSQYKSALAVLLGRAQREGDVRTDFSSNDLAGLLFDTWQGAILRMRVEGSTGPLQGSLNKTFSVIHSMEQKNPG
jgi:TetR/AcrR family transcriptional repressor of nem operon